MGSSYPKREQIWKWLRNIIETPGCQSLIFLLNHLNVYEATWPIGHSLETKQDVSCFFSISQMYSNPTDTKKKHHKQLASSIPNIFWIKPLAPLKLSSKPSVVFVFLGALTRRVCGKKPRSQKRQACWQRLTKHFQAGFRACEKILVS